MTTLAADKPRTIELGEFNDVPMIASDIIYEGALVGYNTAGNARPLVAADPAIGFATLKADNAAGLAGAVYVRVRMKGRIELAISALALADIGKKVYASDDDTFTLTATSNSYVGRVVRWIATGKGIIEYDFSLAQVA